ncbi:hypothetical protein JCM19046_3053 [Bacillus sp. JCM 19046]|nr:hypothetical protein JCM19045_343 [Bacillus sp. JCM 19045]GAF18477.1 hypothetical protein JCM19046_3053 [Bacillus sp. JCM 19046]
MDLLINSRKRHERFVKRVLEKETVWGLESEDGWCVCPSNQYEDTTVMLFWSDEAYARQCAVEEWSHYKPSPLQLEEFKKGWLPGMNEDGLLVGTNWNGKLIGLEVEPYDLFIALKGEWKEESN